jgi:hypothetical protein
MDQIAGRRRKDPWHIHLPDHQPFPPSGQLSTNCTSPYRSSVRPMNCWTSSAAGATRWMTARTLDHLRAFNRNGTMFKEVICRAD